MPGMPGPSRTPTPCATHARSRSLEYRPAAQTPGIYFDNTFLYTEDPTTDAQADMDLEDRTGREPYYRNTTTIGLSNQFNPTDSITLENRYSILENENDDVEDSRENTPSLSWEYGLSQRFSTQGSVAYTQGEFEASDDFQRYEGRLQLDFQFNRRVGAFAAYQHTLLFYDQNADDNYQLKSPSVGLIYQAGEGTRLSVSGGYLWIDPGNRR